jgi:sulfate adenylyltransferase subunit 1
VVKASVAAILQKTNIETFESVGTDEAKLNDIVRVRLKTAVPLVVDEYRSNRVTGAFILVDEQTGNTLAAGLVTATDAEYFTQELAIEPAFSI